MSKKIIIKNSETGEVEYPVILKECILDLEDLATRNEVEALEQALSADKENLKNFKQNVENNYVKDESYNNDKGTIMSQIIDLQKGVAKKVDYAEIPCPATFDKLLDETFVRLPFSASSDSGKSIIYVNVLEQDTPIPCYLTKINIDAHTYYYQSVLITYQDNTFVLNVSLGSLMSMIDLQKQ